MFGEYFGVVMKELLRTPNIVALSALQASLKSVGIESFQFDGPIADTLAGVAEFSGGGQSGQQPGRKAVVADAIV